MSLTFPTGHRTATSKGVYHGTTGEPLRPEAHQTCHCGDQYMRAEDERCGGCGRFPEAVINETWRRRAEEIAAHARKRRAKHDRSRNQADLPELRP